jgi:hypothetical protein
MNLAAQFTNSLFLLLRMSLCLSMIDKYSPDFLISLNHQQVLFLTILGIPTLIKIPWPVSNKNSHKIFRIVRTFSLSIAYPQKQVSFLHSRFLFSYQSVNCCNSPWRAIQILSLCYLFIFDIFIKIF